MYLEDLKASWHQFLEYTVRVVLLSNFLKFLVILGAKTGKDVLKTSSITPEQSPLVYMAMGKVLEKTAYI